MPVIDIIFAVLVVAAIIKGYQKGLVIAVFSIVAFIIGLAAALKLSVAVAAYLQNSISVSSQWLPFISFILVFIIIALLVRWGGKLIERTFKMVLLGWVNKLGGIIFYLALYMIIFSIFLFYAEKVHLLQQASIQSSSTYPFVKPWGPQAIDGFGKIIPLFKDLFTQLESFFSGMSDKIPH